MSFTTMLKNTIARLGNLVAGTFYDLEDGETLVIAINRGAILDITEEMLKENAVIAGTFSDGYRAEFLVKRGFIDKNGDGAGLRVAINRSLHAKGWPLSKNVVDTTVITTVEGVKRLADGFVKVPEPAKQVDEWAQPYVNLFGQGVGLIGGIAAREAPPAPAAAVMPEVVDVKGRPTSLTLTQMPAQ